MLEFFPPPSNQKIWVKIFVTVVVISTLLSFESCVKCSADHVLSFPTHNIMGR